MKAGVLLLGACCALTVAHAGEHSAAWPTNLTAAWPTNLAAALDSAREGQRLVLVHFTASWCGPCQVMGQTTLIESNVIRQLEALERVRLDIDLFRELARDHRVSSLPTFILFSPTGAELHRIGGYRKPEPFRQWLQQGQDRWEEILRQRRRFDERLAEVQRLLASTDTHDQRRAVGILFDLCDASVPELQQRAADKLREVGAVRPEDMLDGLEHPRLATRIHVANVLRSVWGEAFTADPWADPAARQREVDAWRRRLEAPE